MYLENIYEDQVDNPIDIGNNEALCFNCFCLINGCGIHGCGVQQVDIKTIHKIIKDIKKSMVNKPTLLSMFYIYLRFN